MAKNSQSRLRPEIQGAAPVTYYIHTDQSRLATEVDRRFG